MKLLGLGLAEDYGGKFLIRSGKAPGGQMTCRQLLLAIGVCKKGVPLVRFYPFSIFKGSLSQPAMSLRSRNFMAKAKEKGAYLPCRI